MGIPIATITIRQYEYDELVRKAKKLDHIQEYLNPKPKQDNYTPVACSTCKHNQSN